MQRIDWNELYNRIKLGSTRRFLGSALWVDRRASIGFDWIWFEADQRATRRVRMESDRIKSYQMRAQIRMTNLGSDSRVSSASYQLHWFVVVAADVDVTILTDSPMASLSFGLYRRL